MLADRINDAGSSRELFRALTSHTPVGVFVAPNVLRFGRGAPGQLSRGRSD